MTLKIDGFEVSINAKGVYGKNYNKQDTMHLLNLISIWAGEAAKYSDMICDGMGKARKAESDRIYKLLEENGLYKSLNK